MIPINKDNFTLQWNPQTDESYIKIVGIDSMDRDELIKDILENKHKLEKIEKLIKSKYKYELAGKPIDYGTVTLRELKEIMESKYDLF